jgi:N-methylhydantoinase A/oxoprolinase/acetone carboxylase beta subunit
MQAVDRALAHGNVAAAQVGFVVHATTGRTNAIIEGRSRAAASSRPRLPRPARDRPPGAARPSTTPSSRRRSRSSRATGRSTVAERLGPAGEVLRPLEDDSVRAAAAILRREERRDGRRLPAPRLRQPRARAAGRRDPREELPGVPVSLSAEVAPEFREYLRASTTVINAVIRPVVERYLERIESRLADAGVQAKLLVMQSSGGVFSSEAARNAPVFMVESGPAAG